MNIIKADRKDITAIHQIVHDTIDAVYPNYYPTEVVDFFLQHHSVAHIEEDLEKGNIYLLTDNDRIVATGTIDGSYIGRVYVLPECQGKGYGAAIMNYLEALLAKEHETSCLDASLPSYSFYLKLGYRPLQYFKCEVENGRQLCYYSMEKEISVPLNYSVEIVKQESQNSTGIEGEELRDTEVSDIHSSTDIKETLSIASIKEILSSTEAAAELCSIDRKELSEMDVDYSEEIRAFYNQYGLREWDRLGKNIYSQINFQLHMDFIKEYLYPGAKVLDAGCGAGRYSVELAKAGCEVTLFDISEEQLIIAKSKIDEYQLKQQVAGYVRGDLRDLSVFPNNYFDLVICYGAPLSYVISSRDRDTAVKELTRVTKMNGMVALSVNNKWGILKTLLGNCYSDFFNRKEYWYIDQVMATGDLPKHEQLDHPARHFFEASELKDLLQRSGLYNIRLGGSPVFSCGNTKQIEELAQNEAAYQLILTIEQTTYTKPTMIDNGEFLLAKCQKK